MKKGTKRIIIGCALLALQLMSTVGNIRTGNTYSLAPPESLGQFAFDLIFLVSANWSGILGTILLVSGFTVRRKGKKSVSMESAIDRPITPKSPPIQPAPLAPPAKPHSHFCRNCFIAVTAVVCVVVVFLIFALVSQNDQITELNTQVQELNDQISELETAHGDCTATIHGLQQDILLKNNSNESLNQRMDSMSKKIAVFDNNYAVIVDGSSGIYHTFNCIMWGDSDSIRIYDIDEAKTKGYGPCFLCH